jgi:hypothetical protein
MEAEQDDRSDIHRRFDRIASDCLGVLRQASDKGLRVTPSLILQVQQLVSKALEKVHYGFDDELAK